MHRTRSDETAELMITSTACIRLPQWDDPRGMDQFTLSTTWIINVVRRNVFAVRKQPNSAKPALRLAICTQECTDEGREQHVHMMLRCCGQLLPLP